MTRIQRSSEKKKQRKKNLTILIVVLFVLLTGIFARNYSAKIVHTVMYPVNKTFEIITTPVRNIPTYFSSKTILEKQNQELENENRMLKIELLSIDSIKKQNQELKQILNIRDGLAEDRMVGEVILTPPFSPFDTLVARIPKNFEQEDGEVTQKVSVDDSVFIKNISVGKVSEVYDKSVVVKLFSTFGESTPVKIGQDINAEAEGQGSLTFKIELPKDLEISEGEPIYSMAYPETIIGFVEDTQTTETSSFQTIYFKYPFTFSDFSFIEIEY
jgi:cell shape-determining protein MreC